MNETSSSSASSLPPAAASADGAAIDSLHRVGTRADRRAKWLSIAFVVLALLLVAQWWNSRMQFHRLRAEVAARLQSGDAQNAETRTLMKTAQDSLQELQGKVSVLENKQAEAQNQQVALEQLYQDLSRNRDEWALAEIEQVLSTASQQLQLAGNVQGALIALQNAGNRLSHSDKPQFITIRRAIARDIDRLKSLPNVDVTGIALRLDSVISQVDSMPLLSDEKPSLPITPPKTSRRERKSAATAQPANAQSAKDGEWFAMLEEKWQSWTDEMWDEIRQLIRVRNVQTPEALLLSPTQAYYVRENLKLRLMNARLALLSRNEAAFRNDMVAAQDTIIKYFDTRAKHTQVALLLLKQVEGSNLSIEMPTLADSLNAVRNYKTKP
jgi:uroporphyrin-3 C-methyltransferase/uroporphyrinogen III methyltransferase/synthase